MINVNDKLIREELPKIGVDAFAVLMCITSHINRQNKAWPGIERLRTMTGLSKERTYKALKTLVDNGHIERRQKNQSGEFGHMVYHLTTQYLGVFMGVSSFDLAATEMLPLAAFPEHGKPLHGKPLHGNTERISINKREVINKDEVINERESAPAIFHVELHALETLPETSSSPPRGAALADDWQLAAKAMIEYLTANPQQLQSNLKGNRTPPANWPDAVHARMRWMAGQGEWYQLTVPTDTSRLRRWQVQMTAKIASWIDSPFDGAKTGQGAPAAFTPSYSNYKPKE